MWQPTWSPLEVALRAALVYLFVIAVFRVAGRKELGRLSTFDVALVFLVTVALRRTMTGDDTSLTNAFIALATLVGLDRGLSWLAWRSHRLADWLEGPARLLVEDGKLRPRELRRTRVSEDDLRAGLRQHGHEKLEDVRRAYLERDGKLSFVLRSKEKERDRR